MPENLSIFDPVSPPVDAIRNLAVLVMAIAAGIFLVVESILFYCVYRFRRRPTDPRGEPAQLYGSKPIEIAWTAAPALIVFVLVLVTARTLWEVDVDAPAPQRDDRTLFVTVVGRQWWWEYRYEYYDGRKLDFITANELHIPAGSADMPRPVYLALKSADVIHSFWVPRLAGKMDALPGRTNQLWFQTARPGLYLGQCGEYCGTQHAGMLLRVAVDAPDDFERWLAHESTPAVADEAVTAERAFFLKQSCVNCHRVRGTSAAGTYAPDLTHLMTRSTFAAGLFPNTAENLRRWIDDPQKLKPGCLMPAFGLTTGERDQIVRYLLTLR